MKKLPYIIGIPLVAVILVLGGAMLWQLKNKATEPAATAPAQVPGGYGQAGGTAPSNAFGLFGKQAAATPIPTPTPASSADLNSQLDALVDDGGAADIQSLQTDANSL